MTISTKLPLLANGPYHVSVEKVNPHMSKSGWPMWRIALHPIGWPPSMLLCVAITKHKRSRWVWLGLVGGWESMPELVGREFVVEVITLYNHRTEIPHNSVGSFMLEVIP